MLSYFTESLVTHIHLHAKLISLVFAGNRGYADVVVPLLDPTGSLFGGRIIAQGADNIAETHPNQAKYLAHGLAGRERVTIVVDDRHAVWQAHSDNLLSVEPYEYFPSLRTPPQFRGRTLLEQGRDDDPYQGTMMMTLAILEKVHADVFHALRAPSHVVSLGKEVYPSWDVRYLLAKRRTAVLRGVHIVFSRVIPLDANPKEHELWKRAEAFGAVCSAQVGPETTHLVASVGGTEKAVQAVAAGLHLVLPAWLEASCTQWQRADEGKFPVPPAVK